MIFNEGFYEEEIRCGYTVSKEIKKVWAVELDMAQELIRVCQKHGLDVFMDAGTLLGAVRHKGFIPWDDDMDFCMFRKDYDKLVEIAPKEFQAPYFFQNYHTEKGYVRGHAQLRNSQTTGMLKGETKEQYNRGIFIDIFVLDGVPEKIIQQKYQKLKLSLIKKALYQHYHGWNDIKSWKGRCFFPLAVMLVKFAGEQYLFYCMDMCLRKVDINKHENIAPLNFIYETKKRIRNKSLYDETVWLDFENIKLPAPKEYKSYLSKRYGDYMTPIQIPTTHGEIIFDTEIPYSKKIN